MVSEKEIFICVDCEATGLDPFTDRMIEVAAVRFTAKEVLGQFEALIDPECEIPQRSIEIHHITQDMVAGKPKAGEILPGLLAFLEGAIIIGHGISYDLQLIQSEADRARVPCQLRGREFIDTLRLARLYGQSPVNSLERLREHFNIKSEGAHRALSDAVVNMEVFRQLARRYRDTRHILDVLSKPIQMRIMPLGKHKGRQLKEIPIEYLQWAVTKDFDDDLIYSIKQELKRRRKGGHFSDASNPFHAL